MRDGVSVRKYRRHKKEKRSPPTIPEPKPIAATALEVMRQLHHQNLSSSTTGTTSPSSSSSSSSSQQASAPTTHPTTLCLSCCQETMHSLATTPGRSPMVQHVGLPKRIQNSRQGNRWLKEMTADWQLPGQIQHFLARN